MTLLNQALPCLSLLLVFSCFAKDEITSKSNEVYQRVFFAKYTPQTALDMVLRLPGFLLIETDNDVRGFAAGAGNVLIDGRRPTTKSGGIEEALSRIPAMQVAKIEVIRGASGSVDAAGQAVVANVIRVKNGGAKRWQIALNSHEDGKISSSAELVLSEQIQGWDSAFKLNATQQKSPREAQILIYSAEQEFIERQSENRPST
ncbi:MAG: Plug domain-containing protein [Paraglaciecola sp.]|nr:Plug domain-containing protein [Paraglaciecola sp.]